MLVRKLVQKFFDNHLTAYHKTNSVNEPNKYVRKKLSTLKDDEVYDAKKHDEIVNKIKNYEEVFRVIFHDFPTFEADSITTRNAINIFYQFSLLILAQGNVDPLLRPTEADFNAAQKAIDLSKTAIQAHVRTTQSIRRNPLNFIRTMDPNPFKEFFDLVETEFQALKIETLKVGVVKGNSTVVSKDFKTPKDSSVQPVPPTSAAPKLELTAGATPAEAIAEDPKVTALKLEIQRLRDQLGAAQTLNTTLVKQFEDEKAVSIACLKEIGKERISEMAKIDESIKKHKAEFDKVVDDLIKKLRLKEKDSSNLVTIKKDVDRFALKFQDFFKRNLFLNDEKALALPNFTEEERECRNALSLLKTVTYQRTGKNLDHRVSFVPETDKEDPRYKPGTPEWTARRFFEKINELLKFLSPTPNDCEFKKYQGKLGRFDEEYWKSLMTFEKPRIIPGYIFPGTLTTLWGPGARLASQFHGSAHLPDNKELDAPDITKAPPPPPNATVALTPAAKK